MFPLVGVSGPSTEEERRDCNQRHVSQPHDIVRLLRHRGLGVQARHFPEVCGVGAPSGIVPLEGESDKLLGAEVEASGHLEAVVVVLEGPEVIVLGEGADERLPLGGGLEDVQGGRRCSGGGER